MRNRAIALLLMIVLWFGSGCASSESTAPAAPAAEPFPSTVVSSDNLEPSALPTDVENRLRDVAAQALNLSSDAVSLQTAEAVEWGNACLGAARPDEMCAEVITPGYRVVFTSAQGEVTVHSDRTGSSYRLVSP